MKQNTGTSAPHGFARIRRLIGRLELWQAEPEAQNLGVDKTS